MARGKRPVPAQNATAAQHRHGRNLRPRKAKVNYARGASDDNGSDDDDKRRNRKRLPRDAPDVAKDEDDDEDENDNSGARKKGRRKAAGRKAKKRASPVNSESPNDADARLNEGTIGANATQDLGRPAHRHRHHRAAHDRQRINGSFVPARSPPPVVHAPPSPAAHPPPPPQSSRSQISTTNGGASPDNSQQGSPLRVSPPDQATPDNANDSTRPRQSPRAPEAGATSDVPQQQVESVLAQPPPSPQAPLSSVTQVAGTGAYAAAIRTSASLPRDDLHDYSDYEHDQQPPPASVAPARNATSRPGSVATAPGPGHGVAAAGAPGGNPDSPHGSSDGDDARKRSRRDSNDRRSGSGDSGKRRKVTRERGSASSSPQRPPAVVDLNRQAAQPPRYAAESISPPSPGPDGDYRQAGHDEEFKKILQSIGPQANGYFERIFADDPELQRIWRPVARMVRRLYEALGSGGWDQQLPDVRHYLFVGGGEKPGRDLERLKLAETYARDAELWGLKWHLFLLQLEQAAGFMHLKEQFQGLQHRLQLMQSMRLPPPLPEDQPHDPDTYFEEYRKIVVNEEKEPCLVAWQDRVRHFQNAANPDEMSKAQGMLDRVRQMLNEQQDPQWPPEISPEVNYVQEAKALGYGAEEGNRTWVWLKTLGQGGFGHAGLWALHDKHGWIIERRVVKECYLLNGEWAKPIYWRSPRSAGMPREFFVPMTLGATSGGGHIVKVYHCRLYEERTMFRIYMEYCQHGNLDDLIAEHQKFEESKTIRDKHNNVVSCFMPETFMWCLLEALASAACTMTEPNATEGFTHVLHRDLKPLNIFLSAPDPEVWKGYPIPKVGDWGLALECPHSDLPPSTSLKGAGTPGFKAPESNHYQDSGKNPRRKSYDRIYDVSPASDIFSIGMIMFNAMDPGNFSHEQPKYYQVTETWPKFSKEAEKTYDETLKGLVTRCVMQDPGQRPTAKQLWDEVREEVETIEDGESLTMREKHAKESGRPLRLQLDVYEKLCR